jgi:hypothetical protein
MGGLEGLRIMLIICVWALQLAWRTNNDTIVGDFTKRIPSCTYTLRTDSYLLNLASLCLWNYIQLHRFNFIICMIAQKLTWFLTLLSLANSTNMNPTGVDSHRTDSHLMNSSMACFLNYIYIYISNYIYPPPPPAGVLAGCSKLRLEPPYMSNCGSLGIRIAAKAVLSHIWYHK